MGTNEDSAAPHIAEARELAERLRLSLPTNVDAAAIGVMSKAPFKLLCAREALIWRTEELARNSCDAIERGDLAVAGLLVRAIAECAALTWKLMDILDNRAKVTAKELDDQLMRAVVGWKDTEDFPEALHVLSCIDRMDKVIPGVRARYDSLSEIAHPNWSGVLGLYSKIDHAEFVTNFGRGLRTDHTRKMVAKALVNFVKLFEHAYNRISDQMPAFVAEFEPWPETRP